MARKKTTESSSESRPPAEVRKAMAQVAEMPLAVLEEALYRTQLIYPIVARSRFGSASKAGVSTGAAWNTKYKCDRETLADLKSDHRYRICNDAGSPGSIYIYVDGARNGEELNPGECRDVEGKKIEIHQFNDVEPHSGTYENLD